MSRTKIGILALLFALFSGIGAPTALAQAGTLRPLDNIKERMQQDGVHVIDFSSPEDGGWGSLSTAWIRALTDLGYGSIDDFADALRDSFEGEGGLNELRYQVSVLEGLKSEARTDAEREELQDEIDDMRQDIADLEEEIKDAIENNISGAEDVDIDEGKEIIFKEIDFIFGEGKWGNLPYPLINGLVSNSAFWPGSAKKGLAELGKLYFEDARLDGSQGATAWQDAMESLSDDLEFFVTVTTATGASRNLLPDEISQIMSQVIAARYEGERQINSIAFTIFNFFQNLLAGLAIVFIVISGIRMIFSQGDESTITEQKSAITYSIIGLIIILLLGRVIDLLYGTPGDQRNSLIFSDENGNLLSYAGRFDAEILALVDYIQVIVGIVAVFFIVLSGLKAILAQGEEDTIKKQKTAILMVGAGLILLLINQVIIENIFIQPVIEQDDQITSGNVANIISIIGNVLRFILGFTGLIALGVLIWSGATMLLNYGNEETVTKAKSTFRNAIIGLIVILSAYTIVATLIVFK